MNPTIASVIAPLLNGRSVAVVVLLIVVYGAYDVIKSGTASIDKAGDNITVLSKNVEELRLSVVRLADSMEIVKDNIRDHEHRIRELEKKKKGD